MAQEGCPSLQIGASDKIEPARMPQHVRVDFQGGEFRGNFSR